MAAKTGIEWTATVAADGTVTPGASWNPIRARNRETGKVGWHCTKPSAGCKNCYAESINRRLGTGLPYTIGASEQVEVFLDEKALLAPLRWKKPRKIFVCSMTDLFGEFVTDEMIDRVFAVMALCPQHTFQVLTKRAKPMWKWNLPVGQVMRRDFVVSRAARTLESIGRGGSVRKYPEWPLPNVHLGFSAENQAMFDDRVVHMRATPAAVRWVSLEPLLGPIEADFTGFDWVVVGGESGPGARPFDIAWARSIVAQCKEAGVPCFVKQLGSAPVDGWRRSLTDRKGGDPEEWPEDLRVREYPR